ncbi:serine hydrolase domain-containing protein [Tenacibaculum ovolyticum]|uniref:serine hydrolase domain-containing protein n=1 Tax=Tenacibaculum ovolyticum TaxID=104270 RepID=UPI001F4791FE|nr:serine hydrolase [Tenacibaculum ovolyticum]
MIKKITFLLVLLCLQSCHIGRMIRYYKADIDDHKIFPYTEVNKGEEIFYFKDGTNSELANRINNISVTKGDENYFINDFLKNKTETTSFLVIKNDTILFEKYYEGYKRDSISNIFSVSKSVTSLLMGIAIDEGLIKDVNDPITKYIPELSIANKTFDKLTIKHLLNMRSGLKFSESYRSPFDEVSKLYYGTNQIKQISKLEFIHVPGTYHDYQSVCTTLLGIAIERVTKEELGKYLEKKIWKPLQMENNATWSIDDKTRKNTKAFCCLNTTAIDLAKIARLIMNGGRFKGKQIVSEKWINKLTKGNKENDCYQYQWYSYECSEDYYALGILGQIVYIVPSEDLIIIRLGKSDGEKFLSKIKEVVKK